VLASLACALAVAGCGGGGGGGGSGPPDDGGGGPGGNPPPATAIDFRDEIVYQLLTDRFHNGDAANKAATCRAVATRPTRPTRSAGTAATSPASARRSRKAISSGWA
jgi:hypothetical protein